MSNLPRRITVLPESFEENYDELSQLLKIHYNEVDCNRFHIPFKLNSEQLFTLERMGMLVSVLARGESELGTTICGYNILVTQPHLFNPDFKSACNLGLYVAPWLRGTGVGQHLIQVAESVLVKGGADLITYNAKHFLDYGPSLLCPEGYELRERVYTKNTTEVNYGSSSNWTLDGLQR